MEADRRENGCGERLYRGDRYMGYRVIKTREDAETARKLLNGCIAAGEVLYKPFDDIGTFEAFFLYRPKEVAVLNLLADEGDAFASGCWVEGSGKCYITFVTVRPDRRRQGRGRAILAELEQGLKSLSDGRIAAYEIIFFNPMGFTWVVPGTDRHDHPNAPGVDVSGGAYLFFKNCGYRDHAYQNSYHIDLAEYHVPLDIRKRTEALKEKGIEIVLYDSHIHTGLEELMEDLGNEVWAQGILGNAALPGGGDPLLIVNHGGKAMGFAGPLSVQESGRGFFSGIAVHSQCRGNGAGKVLFSYLCSSLRDMGARFMTLFTGETNPARNIYEAAGFHIVRTWADMKKGIGQ